MVNKFQVSLTLLIFLMGSIFVSSGNCAALSVGRSGIDGRMVFNGKPLFGGRVSVYASPELTGEPVKRSGVGNSDGIYFLDLPPGKYYLVASDDGELWSWCGQNPVVVQENKRNWIGFVLNRWEKPDYVPYADGGSLDGNVSGQVVMDGSSVEGVTVSLYLDASDAFRGAGYIRAMPTGADGRFEMDLVPEGKYYLIARKRVTGNPVGPMEKGDLISYYMYNPVRVEGGRSVILKLPLMVKRKDADIYASGAAGRQPGFSGIVSDKDGKPVSGLHVFAYIEPEMGHFKPAAISTSTDEKGFYQIYTTTPGRYYIGARGSYGDSPVPGEYFGFFNSSPDHSLQLTDGKFLKGIDIIVEKVLGQ